MKFVFGSLQFKQSKSARVTIKFNSIWSNSQLECAASKRPTIRGAPTAAARRGARGWIELSRKYNTSLFMIILFNPSQFMLVYYYTHIYLYFYNKIYFDLSEYIPFHIVLYFSYTFTIIWFILIGPLQLNKVNSTWFTIGFISIWFKSQLECAASERPAIRGTPAAAARRGARGWIELSEIYNRIPIYDHFI